MHNIMHTSDRIVVLSICC